MLEEMFGKQRVIDCPPRPGTRFEAKEADMLAGGGG
jgi:hypothetical protein